MAWPIKFAFNELFTFPAFRIRPIPCICPLALNWAPPAILIRTTVWKVNSKRSASLRLARASAPTRPIIFESGRAGLRSSRPEVARQMLRSLISHRENPNWSLPAAYSLFHESLERAALPEAETAALAILAMERSRSDAAATEAALVRLRFPQGRADGIAAALRVMAAYPETPAAQEMLDLLGRDGRAMTGRIPPPMFRPAPLLPIQAKPIMPGDYIHHPG